MIIHCRKHEGTAEVAALLISMCTFGSEKAYAVINFSAYLNICVYVTYLVLKCSYIMIK